MCESLPDMIALMGNRATIQSSDVFTEASRVGNEYQQRQCCTRHNIALQAGLSLLQHSTQHHSIFCTKQYQLSPS